MYRAGMAESAVARLDRSATHVLDSARGTALASPGCALPRAVTSPGGQLAGLDVWPGDEKAKISGCFAASSGAAKVWKSVLPTAAVSLPPRDRLGTASLPALAGATRQQRQSTRTRPHLCDRPTNRKGIEVCG